MIWLWIGFILLVLTALSIDLGVFNRRPHAPSFREAVGWACVWISLALVFNVAIYFMYEAHWVGLGLNESYPLNGRQAALQFLTGYLVEESLSLDNLFVIAIIFLHFRIPVMYQYRVLYWGIMGAMILRGIMIGAGWVLILKFTWITYVFGAMLLATAVKLMISRESEYDPDKNLLIRIARRLFTVTNILHGEHFFIRESGRFAATPLFIVLLAVESADVIFAVDSIPAIFAITQDPFLVFTSNIFAILGLRSIYFALAGLFDRFHYLKMSLVFVLAFVGVKMLLAHYHKIPAGYSLAVIAGILSVGVIASIIRHNRLKGAEE